MKVARPYGCAPPRTFPDLVKKLKARSAESYFWVLRCNSAFRTSLFCGELEELLCTAFRTLQDESEVRTV